MLKNSNRKGLALSAGLALIASLFTVAPAAVAADGAQLQFTPAKGTTYTSLVTEDFQMAVSFKPAYAASSYARLSYIVEKTAGTLDIQVTTSAQALTVGNLSATSTSNSVLASTGTKLTFSPVATTDSGLNGIVLQPSTGSGVANVTSSSAKTTVKVTAFIDSSPTNGVLDAGEWFVTQNVVFVPFSDLTASVTLTTPNEGDVWATASAAVSGINLEQANGKFFFAFSTSAGVMTQSSLIDATKVLSASAPIAAAAANSSVSAQLRYTTSASITTGTVTELVGNAITAESKLIVGARGFNHLTVSALAGSNVTNSTAVRPNAPITVRAGVSTNSTSVSGAAVAFSITTSEELSATKTLTIGTTTYVKSAAAFTASATTAANGFADLVVSTAGFPAGATIVVTATSKGLSDSETYTLTTPAFKVENDYDVYSTTPGSSVEIGFEVTDQWGVKSARADQRVVVTRGGTGFAYAETSSNLSVVSGVASFTFTPAPATKTGSAEVTTALQKFNSDLNLWESGGAAGAKVTINVTETANAFSVSPAASYSASISYIVDGSISWSSVTTVKVKNPGTTVVVSSQGLIFREAAGKASTSDQITLRSDANGGITFDVASTKAGTFTISLAVGTSVTTSQLVVDPAADSAGKTITFDTTAIAAGSTKVITGTLVDANGNPVHTSGSATILVAYVPTGAAGIPIGTMPTETDKDGQFSFTVLTGPNDNGTANVTATYYKSGTSTALKDVLSFTQPITVGAVASEPATNQKLTVGSFKGFVAIYTLNYTGQKLSAKVAGRWLVQENLSRFQRVVRLTGAAIPIKVDLYIDGKFVRTENIVTK